MCLFVPGLHALREGSSFETNVMVFHFYQLNFYLLLVLKTIYQQYLDDISRDTYEKNVKEQRIENSENPNYKEPPTYDQYQKKRKELISDHDETSSETEKGNK